MVISLASVFVTVGLPGGPGASVRKVRHTNFVITTMVVKVSWIMIKTLCYYQHSKLPTLDTTLTHYMTKKGRGAKLCLSPFHKPLSFPSYISLQGKKRKKAPAPPSYNSLFWRSTKYLSMRSKMKLSKHCQKENINFFLGLSKFNSFQNINSYLSLYISYSRSI